MFLEIKDHFRPKISIQSILLVSKRKEKVSCMSYLYQQMIKLGNSEFQTQILDQMPRNG